MVNQSFSWDQFQSPQPTQPQPEKQEEKPSTQKKEFSWGELQNTSTYQGKPDPTADESTFGYLLRNAISHTARAYEGSIGKYGNVEKLVRTAIAKAPSAFGLLGKSIYELVGKENWEKFFLGEKGDSHLLATPEDIRQLTEMGTGDYTKPKTKNEKRTQELSGDIGSLGGGPSATVGRTLVNKLGIPAAANAAKGAVEELGFGEDKGNWTKMAAWLSLSLLNNVNGAAYAAGMMNQGRQGFGPNVSANVPRYEGSINRHARSFLQGDPRSSLAQQQVAGIRDDIASGRTTMADLMNRYDAINAAKRDRGLFDLSKIDRASARRNIDQVKIAVKDEIEHLGRSNPQALQSWQDGIKAFSVIHRSNSFTNSVQEALTGPYAKLLSTPVAGLFGGSLYGAAKAPGMVIGGAAIAPALYKTAQVGFRVWNDPNLSFYYWNALNFLRQENHGAFIKNFVELDKEYDKKYGKSSIKKPDKKKR